MNKKYFQPLVIVVTFFLLTVAEKHLAAIIGFKNGNIPLYTPLLLAAFVLATIVYLFKYFRQTALYVFTVLLSTLIILSAIEVFFYFLNKRQERIAEKKVIKYFTADGTNTFNKPDSIFGYVPKPNGIDTVRYWKDGKHICDIVYHIDSLGMRVNPLVLESPEVLKRKYALFFGCSVTFGDNESDKGTLPYLFNTLDTNFVSYNFACGGYGTQHMWLQLKKQDIKKKVVGNKADGVAFYIYINAHMNRVYGGMKEMTQWAGELPSLEMQGDSIVFKGMLNSQHPTRTAIYRLLAKSQTLKYFQYDIPKNIPEQYYRLNAKIIAESAAAYEQEFGNKNFYVVTVPGNDTTILSYLKPYHIKTINLSGITEHLNDSTYCTLIDRHPSAKANKLVAEEIIKAIGDF